jgi:hypothetical protein
LEEELKLINKSSINAFGRAIERSRRPEVDSHKCRRESHPTQIQSGIIYFANSLLIDHRSI